jgi:hypothetical protein
MFFSASFIISNTFLSGINEWLNTIISLCLFLLPVILFKLNSDINSLVFHRKKLFKNDNE